MSIAVAMFDPDFFPNWLFMTILFFTAFAFTTIFGFLSLKVFYHAWQATATEMKEGGAVDVTVLTRTLEAVKYQFFSAAGAMVTGSFFFLAMGLEQARFLNVRYTREPGDQTLAWLTNFVVYIAVFIDSLCNVHHAGG